MGGELKKIDSIKNMAVFQDFNWRTSVRDKGNNVDEFKKINILYGRNYSGKTTLSRIFRAMETGSLSEKYSNPEFQASFDGGASANQNLLTNHGQTIRVFNEDFVKENLRFIVDDEQAINSFAILGEDNAKIEEEIEKNDQELGLAEDKSGFVGEMLEAVEAHQAAVSLHNNTASNLEKKLKDKANKAGTGIKHDKTFGEANYNVNKIKSDINKVTADSYVRVTPEQNEQYHDLLKEEPKPEITELKPFKLSYSDFSTRAQGLIEKKIQSSEPIQELLSDAALELWVRNGRSHHEGKKSKCSFCGNGLPVALWEKLDKHFNKESEELRIEIEQLVVSIESEISRIPNLLNIKSADFYVNFKSDLEKLREDFLSISTSYLKTMTALKTQLKDRKDDIFTSKKFAEPTSVEKALSYIYDSYEDLRNKSNQFTSTLSADQLAARSALRLNEVSTFVNDIKYNDECTTVKALKESMDATEQVKISATEKVNNKKSIIRELRAKLEDEGKGADRVNDYLNNFFGHQSLSLKAIQNVSDGEQISYRFEITRDEQRAFHLSEGECSLIAFCYFMAKLEDVETKGNQPIIWIDDPICSLDSNHIFFVYSLINAQIVTPKKYEENGETKERENFKQLFISTHNLDFLKYLKRLPGASNNRHSRYFMVSRNDQQSHIALMPAYLKEYVTEFNFLFHQVYKCATAQIELDDNNYNDFYNFGNNTRKFLEAFLYYKYPNAAKSDNKLFRFFGDDPLASSLTDRINNEYSHLEGVFERSLTPIDVPEMRSVANFILRKIKDKDPEQYGALLESISADSDPIEND